jgi:hypothetical protein
MYVGHRYAWFVFLLLVAIVVGMACRTYYASVFLPGFHDGWTEAWSRLIDFEGWWAVVSSPVGMTLNLVWIVPLVLALGLLIWPNQAKSHRTTHVR